MANEQRIDPRKLFTPRWLPWVLAVAGLIVYVLTLNHWASLLNRGTVAKISGWTWQPEIYNPVFFVVTYPFHWLPVAQIPIALNLFAAICAAATLGLLARAVAILPHDRTDAQRERERGVFGFLTLRSAWLPPVFAVLVCGLQMTFWERATNCSNEMFDLLLLVFVIWSLLEYRLDEREGRLLLAAVVFGAGMTDNWAMIGFLPLFMGAVIWTRGRGFFRLRFVRNMLLCGLAGMLFYLLLPLLACFSHAVPVTFWQALKLNLISQWVMVKLFFIQPEVRKTLILLSPASLLPVVLLSIRWNLTGGDVSKIGMAMTRLMFHLIHAVLLFLCVWVAFDPPFSPRQLGHTVPFLAFYYLAFYFLGALSVGYFTGYFLLVFSRPPIPGRSRHARPDPFRWVNRGVLAGIWLFAALAVTGLAYKNIPQIRDANDNTFQKYAVLTTRNLPPSGAIVLSDDSLRSFFVQAELAREGQIENFAVVDTASLAVPAYHRFLHQNYPTLWPNTIAPAEETNGVSPMHLINLLGMLGKSHPIYYLHPSYGYFFELFYLEPRGLAYKLAPLPNDTLQPPLPDQSFIAANQAFWNEAETSALAPIIQTVSPDDSDTPLSWGEQLLNRFHIAREPNPNAAEAGIFYSRDVNFWGVQLQRANELKAAADRFALAKKLNPDNLVAQINLDFNQRLQAGQRVPVDLSKATSDQFGKYRSWNELLTENGPFDEPSFCFEEGVILMRNRLTRQAVEPFERVRQLAPDNLGARLWLAQAYVASRLPERALDVLQALLDHPEKFAITTTNSSQVNILAAAAYFQKNDNANGIRLVETEISRQPTNEFLLTTATQIYLKRGLFTNALAIIDRQLKAEPDNPSWLFGKGYAAMQAKNYQQAIPIFTHILSVQSTNRDALFNRAVANLQSGQLDAARTDYETLGQTFTNSFQVAYGLGEIAWRKHETNEAIKNYELYLHVANTNTAEATNIMQRLRELRGGPN